MRLICDVSGGCDSRSFRILDRTSSSWLVFFSDCLFFFKVVHTWHTWGRCTPALTGSQLQQQQHKLWLKLLLFSFVKGNKPREKKAKLHLSLWYAAGFHSEHLTWLQQWVQALVLPWLSCLLHGNEDASTWRGIWSQSKWKSSVCRKLMVTSAGQTDCWRTVDTRTDGWTDGRTDSLCDYMDLPSVWQQSLRTLQARPATEVVISLRRLPQSATNILSSCKNSWGSGARLLCHFILTFIPCW